jgi:uncharacterized protein GlcG (DUF336 family)
MDGAPLISVQTAMKKAYAAAAIGMPPDDFYAQLNRTLPWHSTFLTGGRMTDPAGPRSRWMTHQSTQRTS